MSSFHSYLLQQGLWVYNITLFQYILMTASFIDWVVGWFYRHFKQYFSYILAVSFICGGNQSARIRPPTCSKLLKVALNTIPIPPLHYSEMYCTIGFFTLVQF